ncbi:hypothetical protein L6164_035921 [Bauhinia variegata]|uniref:Uncharacterized protein n=1 Tax=Bauhinia variegata TaxID=167791 RepID=A0ACB9KFF9_BAUVA|nr:hypothetical protein L6164_035921 [Bauhinia variegata]
MASLQALSRFSSLSYGSSRAITATIDVPKIRVIRVNPPKLPRRGLVAELDYINNYTTATTRTTTITHIKHDSNSSGAQSKSSQNSMEVVKLHMIMEIVADRVEMHKHIGAQRDNWNRLLLTCTNMITLSAATMAGLAAMCPSGAPLLAIKVSSTILYVAATVILVVMNKIQPSQLAEEQRNAARLFKQLNGEIRTTLSLGNPTMNDVDEAMEKVLALDRAYPLPLLGTMLEKFPQTVEPAVWWPQWKQNHLRKGKGLGEKSKGNGWDAKLEAEMKEIVKVLQRKDIADYLKLSKKVLNFNKMLAISGLLLTALAALGSAFVGSVNAAWPVMFGVIPGALSSVVNTLEHGGQAGMVFELYRGAAGFFKLMEETIQLNINEQDRERRENGELLEMRVALQLGRSLSELRQLAASSSFDQEKACEEFASKLF